MFSEYQKTGFYIPLNNVDDPPSVEYNGGEKNLDFLNEYLP